ncbi:hypothetical protein C8R47DRAFT_552766 [Mycena vitilis]|nr:hypothetical protein C8R47DRAFT_552766 [Mycena vitilis]
MSSRPSSSTRSTASCSTATTSCPSPCSSCGTLRCTTCTTFADGPVRVSFSFLSFASFSSSRRLRLVIPPPLFSALQAPFTWLAHRLVPAAVANAVIAGAFASVCRPPVFCYCVTDARCTTRRTTRTYPGTCASRSVATSRTT